MPSYIDSIERAVDHVLAVVPGQIVLATPLGIGKPNPFLNALYQRIKADPMRRLKIMTALSLEKPVGASELERCFLEPFVARVFADYPDLDYVKDRRVGKLPPNIEVLEFFFKTGDYLGNAEAQQSYISTNYTFAARDLALHGVNVLAQAVAAQGQGESLRLSLSCNTDTTAELVERVRAQPGHQLVVVGVVNSRCGAAEPGEHAAPRHCGGSRAGAGAARCATDWLAAQRGRCRVPAPLRHSQARSAL